MAVKKAAPKRTQQLYVANADGFVEVKGTEYHLRKGETRVVAGHPLLSAAPELFDPAEDRAIGIEQATSAPGEARGE